MEFAWCKEFEVSRRAGAGYPVCFLIRADPSDPWSTAFCRNSFFEVIPSLRSLSSFAAERLFPGSDALAAQGDDPAQIAGDPAFPNGHHKIHRHTVVAQLREQT